MSKSRKSPVCRPPATVHRRSAKYKNHRMPRSFRRAVRRRAKTPWPAFFPVSSAAEIRFEAGLDVWLPCSALLQVVTSNGADAICPMHDMRMTMTIYTLPRTAYPRPAHCPHLQMHGWDCFPRQRCVVHATGAQRWSCGTVRPGKNGLFQLDAGRLGDGQCRVDLVPKEHAELGDAHREGLDP